MLRWIQFPAFMGLREDVSRPLLPPLFYNPSLGVSTHIWSMRVLGQELQTRERLDLVTVIDKIGGQMDETRRFLKQVKSNLVRIELADCEVAED